MSDRLTVVTACRPHPAWRAVVLTALCVGASVSLKGQSQAWDFRTKGSFKLLIFLIYWPHCVACRVLVPWPGVGAGPGSESAGSEPLELRGSASPRGSTHSRVWALHPSVRPSYVVTHCHGGRRSGLAQLPGRSSSVNRVDDSVDLLEAFDRNHIIH